jgi:hypothetical protein
MSVLVLLITPVVVCVGLIVARSARRRGRRRLAALARSLGLSYRAQDVLDLPQRYRALAMMREGHDRRVRDVMSGPTRWGALSCFSYRYEVGLGVSRAVNTWKVAVLESGRSFERVTFRRGCGGNGSNSAATALRRGGWTISSRAGDPQRNLPDCLNEWLESVDHDLALELCDRLIAVQVPLGGLEQSATSAIEAVKQVADRLCPPQQTPARNAGNDETLKRGAEHAGP